MWQISGTQTFLMTQNSYRPPEQFGLFPPVIKHLLIVNVLAFLLQLVGSTSPSPALAALTNLWLPLYPIGNGFMPWQVITYAFLHGGIGHLFFNMFALWMFGVQLEMIWGSRRFGIYYFVCVIGAALAQLATTYGGPPIPTVGASGGVFGILLAFGMTFPNQPIYLIFFPVPIKAKWFVLGYGALELFSGVTGTSQGIAHFAHLGGMVVGFILLLYWRGQLPIKPEHRIY